MRGTLRHSALTLLFSAAFTIQLGATGPPGQGSASAPQLRKLPSHLVGAAHPSVERKTENGCYTTEETALGMLPSGSLFWHLDAYPSRAAAEAARGPRGTVTESFGSIGSLRSLRKAGAPQPETESPLLDRSW